MVHDCNPSTEKSEEGKSLVIPALGSRDRWTPYHLSTGDSEIRGSIDPNTGVPERWIACHPNIGDPETGESLKWSGKSGQ